MHSLDTVNIAVLAHVDAGKTSLTERLLFDAGVLDALGSVDAGSTRTDAMELERRRGITIRSAVATFDAGDVRVNLIDTPGHPDFIAEIERALAVLDAAVLVVSAVEGVQSHTVVLWRALQRLQVPTLVFVNKIDRAGAEPERVAAEVAARLRTRVAVLSDRSSAELLEPLGEVDDALLQAWADGTRPDIAPGPDDIAAALRRAVAARRITPVLFGSALTGAGVPELVDAIEGCVPRPLADADADASGVAFKIDRSGHGRQVYIRMRSGTVRRRARLRFGGHEPERVTGIRVSSPDGFVERDEVGAGQIGILTGLSHVRIGDAFGPGTARSYRFPPAAFESVVVPDRPGDKPALFAALSELADQDPLIALRVGAQDEVAVSLYGEVQAEVLTALLHDDFGVAATFRPAVVVHVEELTGTGHAVSRIGDDDNPYLATIGLRVEPGDGIGFALEAERGSMPAAFFTAIEDGVRGALEQGPHGWPIRDCAVTITDTGYAPRQSHAHQSFNKDFSSIGADFRRLAPVILFAALARAGTRVCEPVDRIDVEVPSEDVVAVLALLGRCGGSVSTNTALDGYTRLEGELPTVGRREFAARLPGLTRGHGVLVARFERYRPVRGRPPVRPRRGPDPGNRASWVRAMPR